MFNDFDFPVNDNVIHIWTVKEANAFINTNRVRKVKFEGRTHTFYSKQEVYRYGVLLESGEIDTIFVEDIVTVDSSKLM